MRMASDRADCTYGTDPGLWILQKVYVADHVQGCKRQRAPLKPNRAGRPVPEGKRYRCGRASTRNRPRPPR